MAIIFCENTADEMLDEHLAIITLALQFIS